MSQIIDNLIAYRVLSMLVKPFIETEAFKLGIIDAQGKNLIKSKDFTTQEQKNAYNYLTRLVFNMKRIINKLPGGESKLKNLVAAFFLVKEAYKTRSTTINEDKFHHILKMLDEGVVLVEEQLIVEDFILCEEGIGGILGPGGAPSSPLGGIANVTGARVSTDQPVVRAKKKPRRFARFTVNDEVYNKFTDGKAKFRKWAEYLNLEDEGQKMIYNFAKKNPNGVIILHNGKNTKSIRFNRRGGGNWSKIKRPAKQVNNKMIT